MQQPRVAHYWSAALRVVRGRVYNMMRHFFLPLPSNLTAVLKRSLAFQHAQRYRFSDNSHAPSQTRLSELPKVPSLVDGCDYAHWLVVMRPPDNYPKREEIIQQYVATLASAIGSEKAAKESIYSVSTKYYFAFSCRVGEDVAHKIKSLPRVKWVLPDSYLGNVESGYGGEPYVNGEVCAYDDKYHADWLRDNYGEDSLERGCSRKPRRRRRRKCLCSYKSIS